MTFSRARIRIFLCLSAVAALLLACSSSGQTYAGIDMRQGAAPQDVQDLAARAKAGDKEAQFDLGERYETGNGVLKDMRLAKTLFLAAAQDVGDLLAYSPPVGRSPARIITLKSQRAPGLDKAKQKLSRPEYAN